jgi:hypothetical protein
LQGPWNVLIPFIGYHLLTAYALPGAVRLFSNGFWRRVWRRLRDLMQQTYEGDRTLYAEFQHHVGALLLTAPMVCGALIVGDALALRRPLTLGLAMLTAYCAQVLAFRSLHRRSGTMLFSVIAALVAAGFGGSAYVRLSGFGATWGGIVTGVMVFLLMLAVIYPVFYLSVRTLFYRLGRWRLADWVGAIFARSSGAYQQYLVDADRRTRAAYLGDERSVTHARHFLHLMNVICAGGIGWWTHRVWPDYWLIALGLALLSYACIGRLLTFNARGLVLFAGAIGISAGIYLAVPVWAMGDALLIRVAALGTALFVSIAVVMVLLVPAYLMLRTVLLSWNEAWLGPSLQWLHSKVWWPCGWFGRRVSAALRELVKKLAPLFDRIGRALARIREAYERLLAQIRGRG